MTAPPRPPSPAPTGPASGPASGPETGLEGAAERIARGVTRMLTDHGHACLTEFCLADGRRADVLSLDRAGLFTVVEIKSGLADYRSDHKWPEYAAWCDAFAFAVEADFPIDVLPADVGLIIADAYGAAIVRPPITEKLNAARRKALTLRFARTAAQRLAPTDPARI